MKLPLVAVIAIGGLFAGCGAYSDFRLPELSETHPGIQYAWFPYANPVLSPGGPGDWDGQGVRNPSIVRRGSAFSNFYSGFDGHTWRTGLATSADGVAWHKEGAVLAPETAAGEGTYMAANGASLFHDGEFWYWYQAGPKEAPQLGLARSSDGLHWRKSRFPVVDLGPSESWDERGLSDPYVMEVRQHFYLFYVGQDRTGRRRIGVARSLDGEHWRKSAAPFAGIAGEQPAVWIAHGYYWMLYSADGALQIARSTDGIHWEKRSPPGPAVSDPAIELLGGRLAAWFGAGSQIGVAILRAEHTAN